MQPKRQTTILHAIAALVASAGVGAAHEARPCRHLGADWIAPRVVNIGATQCPNQTFTFTIGSDAFGAQVNVTYHGCPAFIDMEPGHGALVQRLHKNPVGPQTLFRTRQAYKAKCGGWFSAPSCTPDGPAVDLAHSVDHWDEEACPVVVGPPVIGDRVAR